MIGMIVCTRDACLAVSLNCEFEVRQFNLFKLFIRPRGLVNVFDIFFSYFPPDWVLEGSPCVSGEVGGSGVEGRNESIGCYLSLAFVF